MPASTTPAPTAPAPTTPAPAVTAPATAPANEEAPAWLGAFTDALAKTVSAEVEKAVKSSLAAAPAPTEKG